MEAVCYTQDHMIFELFGKLNSRVKGILAYMAKVAKSDTKTSVLSNAREDTAVKRVLEEYGNTILRTAYAYLHNMADAEDILQDTMIKYLKSAPVFENKSHEKAWLLKVTSNLSKNKIDYNKLRQTDELEETLLAQQREDLAFVWDAVKELPASQRGPIHLYYYEGLSTKEIAAVLQCRDSTVRSNLKRGREKLKEILKEGYDFE